MACPAVESEVWFHASTSPDSLDVDLRVLGVGSSGIVLYGDLTPMPGRAAGAVALKVIFASTADAPQALEREAILPFRELQRTVAGQVHANICSVYSAYVAPSESGIKVSVAMRAAWVSAGYAETFPVRIPAVAIAERRVITDASCLVRLNEPIDAAFAAAADRVNRDSPPRSRCTLLSHATFALPLSPFQLQCVALQLLLGARFMHGNRLIHRDIKPDNAVVVAAIPHAKGIIPILQLIDYGDQKLVQEAPVGIASVSKGTHAYAPYDTAIVGQAFDGRADVFMIGATIFALATSVMPIADRRLGFPERFNAVALQVHFAEGTTERSFLQGTTMLDASRRLTTVEAIAHPWLADARAALPEACAARIEVLRARTPPIALAMEHVCDVGGIRDAVRQAALVEAVRLQNHGAIPVGAVMDDVPPRRMSE